MNIYKISQELNKGDDTYDAAVVIAASEDEARLIHPAHGTLLNATYTLIEGVFYIKLAHWPHSVKSSDWCKVEDVQVEFIGNAGGKYTKPQVICNSYNSQ